MAPNVNNSIPRKEAVDNINQLGGSIRSNTEIQKTRVTLEKIRTRLNESKGNVLCDIAGVDRRESIFNQAYREAREEDNSRGIQLKEQEYIDYALTVEKEHARSLKKMHLYLSERFVKEDREKLYAVLSDNYNGYLLSAEDKSCLVKFTSDLTKTFYQHVKKELKNLRRKIKRSDYSAIYLDDKRVMLDQINFLEKYINSSLKLILQESDTIPVISMESFYDILERNADNPDPAIQELCDIFRDVDLR